VVGASVYALRLFIRSMHNRVGPEVRSHEIGLRDGLVLTPLIGAILFLALYPQPALKRSERSASAAVAGARSLTEPNVLSIARNEPRGNGVGDPNGAVRAPAPGETATR
jgi:NADH-quinone oxidoreductase subunit M